MQRQGTALLQRLYTAPALFPHAWTDTKCRTARGVLGGHVPGSQHITTFWKILTIFEDSAEGQGDRIKQLLLLAPLFQLSVARVRRRALESTLLFAFPPGTFHPGVKCIGIRLLMR
jgi:hypothetical protein